MHSCHGSVLESICRDKNRSTLPIVPYRTGLIMSAKERSVLERLSMNAGPGSTTIVVTRFFDAPPSAVFEAWTRTEHVAHWWDPSVSVPEHPLHLRPGTSVTSPLRSFWLVLTFRGTVLAVLRDTQSRHQGRGNVVIPKGFPKSGERVVESHKAWVSPPPSSQSKHVSSFFTQRRHGMDVRGALGRHKACC
jgi:hypothetical protein